MSLVVASAQPAAAQGFKWWQMDRFQKGLSLTQEQIDRIEAIFQTAEPSLRAQKTALDKAEHKLSKIITNSASDEATVLQAAELVEAARAELSRTRTLQLFRMRRVLTDEQNTKMKEMHDHDRRERERDRKPKGDLSHDLSD
ncbi:MAG: periplasmic heavy metal sensor [Acidobacteriota bacterium]|nr:periplasmic heavy metal sensor [Acidobacteriota bacterium]